MISARVSKLIPTRPEMRYRFWYMHRPVVQLKWDRTGIRRILGGAGEPFVMHGGRVLDSILVHAATQEIDDFIAEPMG